jgi:hypothetical protein
MRLREPEQPHVPSDGIKTWDNHVYPVSGILHLASRILHPVSCTLHPVSYILYLESCILNLASGKGYNKYQVQFSRHDYKLRTTHIISPHSRQSSPQTRQPSSGLYRQRERLSERRVCPLLQASMSARYRWCVESTHNLRLSIRSVYR